MMQPTPNESRIHTDELVDIREVSVDKNLPKEERIAAFIRQIKNPYRFRCGKDSLGDISDKNQEFYAGGDASAEAGNENKI